MSAHLLPLLAVLFATPALADAGHAQGHSQHYDFGHPAGAAEATRSVEIRMGEMFYGPASLQVKAGETVRFVLKNEGILLHEFGLGSAAMHAEHQKQMARMLEQGLLTPTGMAHRDHAHMGHGTDAGGHGMLQHDDPNSVLVEPGKNAELTWTFTRAAELEFACNIPGHYQAGMTGRLRIVP